jgi:AhpC/TSA family
MKGKSLIGLWVLIVALIPLTPAYSAYQVGDTVTDWTLYDADGNAHKLSDYMGKIVMLNFWDDG